MIENFKISLKYIFLFIYALFSVLIIIFDGGYFNLCKLIKFHQSFFLNIFIPAIFLAIIGIVYEYLFKPKFKTLYYGIIPILILALAVTLIDKNKEKNLRNKVSIVTKAVVYKTGKTKQNFLISVSYFKYYDKEYKYFQTFAITGRTHKCKRTLLIGDTVLLMYSKKCPAIIDLYKVCPTKAELKKCKNDCYLINGKLIPVSEYKKSKNKELY